MTMTKIKGGLMALMVLMGFSVFAQTVQEARKLLYYERYQGARDMLEKIVSGNPNDAEAVYWLSQVLIDQADVAGAKEVLRKGMSGANGSSPLLLAGMGHVELLEGKNADARQRFETALSLTKAKDVAVLNAIGHANTEKNGDADYAIEKLKLATQVKGFKEPDVYINMGDAYRKKLDGGGAVSAYQNALTIDPKHAAAKHKIARVYLTQGKDQEEVFLRNFTEASTIDPAYSPAYYNLYSYYFARDVNKATDYFNKYKTNADSGPALDYEEASLNFARGDYKGAIAKADQLMASQGDKADARLHRLKGYSYDKMGDSVNAVKEMDVFFEKARPDQVVGDNYVMIALNSAKLPERQSKVDWYLNKAIEVDTVQANRIDYAKKGADFFKKAGNQPKCAEWWMKVLELKGPAVTKTELFYAGLENFNATNYQRSDSIFGVYKTKYPDEAYGYYWSFRSRSVIDSTMEAGLAIADCQKFIEVAELDKVKFKNTLITAYGYMAGYNANVKKDFGTAIGYLDRILVVDPANADAAKNKEILQKAMGNKGAVPAAPKTAGTGAPVKTPGTKQP